MDAKNTTELVDPTYSEDTMWTTQHGDLQKYHEHNFPMTGRYKHSHDYIYHLTGKTCTYYPVIEVDDAD